MLRTIECEAAVFGCATVAPQPTEKGGPPDPSCLLAVPGAAHLLSRLPPERWGALALDSVDATLAHLEAAELPRPGIIVGPSGTRGEDYAAAAAGLGADPSFCLAIEETPEGIAAALGIDMKVIALTTQHTPHELAGADMVIPSLLSLNVVGLHPVLILEVDALPEFGTFIPGQYKRR